MDNEYVRRSISVLSIAYKMRENRLRCFEHKERKVESYKNGYTNESWRKKWKKKPEKEIFLYNGKWMKT